MESREERSSDAPLDPPIPCAFSVGGIRLLGWDVVDGVGGFDALIDVLSPVVGRLRE